MGTALTGSTVASTYDALLKVTDNGPLGGTAKVITDGMGNDSVLKLGTAGMECTGTLGVTGVSSFANGAVGTPSITFTSDPDSGLYRIGADNIGVAVNGAKVLDVATSGLAVTGALTASSSIGAINSAGQANLYIDGTGGDAIARFRIGGVEKATWRVNDADQNLIAEVGGSERGRFTVDGLDVTGEISADTAKFGTHSALGAETVTGFISITDAAGNARKLAVVS